MYDPVNTPSNEVKQNSPKLESWETPGRLGLSWKISKKETKRILPSIFTTNSKEESEDIKLSYRKFSLSDSSKSPSMPSPISQVSKPVRALPEVTPLMNLESLKNTDPDVKNRLNEVLISEKAYADGILTLVEKLEITLASSDSKIRAQLSKNNNISKIQTLIEIYKEAYNASWEVINLLETTSLPEVFASKTFGNSVQKTTNAALAIHLYDQLASENLAPDDRALAVFPVQRLPRYELLLADLNKRIKSLEEERELKDKKLDETSQVKLKIGHNYKNLISLLEDLQSEMKTITKNYNELERDYQIIKLKDFLAESIKNPDIYLFKNKVFDLEFGSLKEIENFHADNKKAAWQAIWGGIKEIIPYIENDENIEKYITEAKLDHKIIPFFDKYGRLKYGKKKDLKKAFKDKDVLKNNIKEAINFIKKSEKEALSASNLEYINKEFF